MCLVKAIEILPVVQFSRLYCFSCAHFLNSGQGLEPFPSHRVVLGTHLPSRELGEYDASQAAKNTFLQ